uniref:J domain-containing protein n=1 Tax=Tetraselmis chuii TaxID=63592 RepID=A0A7S1X074_9CHLO|mmetsp:Transcript_15731/g.27934  ORF Transcript_15731/g.27934 Transcript_15731/m.27934 type:complete len:299 (+) Transcript_15731:212-1108(+)|eukprot:CAMPEP_0177763720 /NCGR_PEP_ID=MMETSP0491_2-20121128/7017_1 /TAXON_ID=63592 /ORGANISM="Tetraselmis chuii, Strain PLY429" /LENGTH=298 /DNA_ID=CAMNT_0019279837 /DNA_START=162 /DNA_END=1058 /DNA_ORIENTATION=-
MAESSTAAAPTTTTEPPEPHEEIKDDTLEAIEALPENADQLLKEFFVEVKETDRDNEVIRILEAFKLNPFDQLGVRYDATVDQINSKYRGSSLLIHPDKCKHVNARDAFEVLRRAHKTLLEEEKRNHLIYLLNYSRDLVRKERKKATKHDAAIRLAASLHERGREGVEEEWEKTEDFHEKWRDKSYDVLAKAEFRKRKLETRLKEDQLRLEEDETTARERMKSQREHNKKWEETRDVRVGGWRDFMTKNKTKKQKGAIGGLRPPKLKEEDAEKTYVQRPVGREEFRPKQAHNPKVHRK